MKECAGHACHANREDLKCLGKNTERKQKEQTSRWIERFKNPFLFFSEFLTPNKGMAAAAAAAATETTETKVGTAGDVPQYVKLVSGDGQEFFVERECALLSGTIRAMLEGPGNGVTREEQEQTLPFRDISGPVLEKVVQYFYYKRKYQKVSLAQDTPEFVIDPKIVLELLMASNFLDA